MCVVAESVIGGGPSGVGSFVGPSGRRCAVVVDILAVVIVVAGDVEVVVVVNVGRTCSLPSTSGLRILLFF